MSETKKRNIPSPEFKAKVGLAGVSRATVYAHQKPKPFYGSRKMEALRSVGQSGIKAHRPHQSL